MSVKPPDSSDSTERPSTGSTDPGVAPPDAPVPPDPLPAHIIARPEYVGALMDDTDRQGRKLPKRLGAITMLSRWTRQEWKRVPDEFYAVDVNDEGYSQAVISCVCGATPHVEVLMHEKCPGCYRWFLFGGDRVLVAYGEMPPPPADG